MRLNYLRILAFALGGLSTVIAAGALYLYATFDGLRLATELSQFVRQRYQRVLRIDGPVELSMFPRLVLRLPPTSMSTRNGAGEFMAVEQASISVRLMPLLARRVVVDQLELDGLRLALLRDRNGRLNADDLLATHEKDGEAAASPVDLDLGALQIRRSALTWSDEAAGRQLALSDISLESGRVGRNAEGRLVFSARLTRAAPAADLQLELQTAYRHDEEGRSLRLRQLHAAARGDVDGWQGLVGEASATEILSTDGQPVQLQGGSLQARLKTAAGNLELKGSSPRLQFDAHGPQAELLDATLNLEGSARSGKLQLHVNGLAASTKGLEAQQLDADIDLRTPALQLSGKLASPLRWPAGATALELPALGGSLELTPAGPEARPHRIDTEASLRLDLNRGSASGGLSLHTDGSHIRGKWSVTPSGSPTLGFDLDVDHFDLATLASRKPGARSRNNTGEAAGSPLDLTALQGLDLEGTLRFEQLKAAGLHLEKLRLPLRIRDGRLVSSGHSMSLYGGSLDGSLSIDSANRQMAYRGYLQGASLGPLLRGLNGTEALTGTTNFFVDVAGTGATLDALLGDLHGTARLRIRNGTVPGIDVGQAFREWRSQIGTRQSARRSFHDKESTAIGELTASFQVDKGIATSTDLLAKGGMLKITGEGQLDLPRQSIDYLSHITLLVVPVGPDSGPLSSLRGVTVPIRVKGLARRPDWHLEPAAALPAAVASASRKVIRQLPRVIPGVRGRADERPPSAPPPGGGNVE
ncbi:AsmA family protein [Zoogloea sp.]|uniref:AsmA family protein n=1 Tax=Zoogloea sp. TaxID=49181 RepID=UPI00141622A8|nr:MAG: AsmA family protein [Zoogloea sp.]